MLSSDRIRKLRAGIDPYEHAAPSAYGDVESRAVYAELAQRAAAAVRRDGGAIVDATFRRAADADAFAAARPSPRPPAWLVCEAPPAVLIERAAARAARGSVSDAGPADRRRRARRVPGTVPGAGTGARAPGHHATDPAAARSNSLRPSITPGSTAPRGLTGRQARAKPGTLCPMATTETAAPLSAEELARLDAWWRAANYLSVGQIYLLDNPLLREPLHAGAHQAAAARPLGHHARA